MSQHERHKWNERYTAGSHRFTPSPFLLSLDSSLPKQGRALDVAGGDGRHAIWLAQRGLSVTLLDISEVALDLARGSASACGVDLNLVAADLDEQPLPEGPWDLILIFNYLKRSLYRTAADQLRPGGLLVTCQPTHKSFAGSNRTPPAWVLSDNELPALIPPQLTVLESYEGAIDAGGHQARLIAQRTSVSATGAR